MGREGLINNMNIVEIIRFFHNNVFKYIIFCFLFMCINIPKRYWVIIATIIVLILISIPFRYYFIEFGQYSRSYEHEAWGQFGDFIGGLLNPIIGIITLGFTMYIAYIANKITKQQTQPYCNIIFNDYDNLVGIDIENAGNGPLIIKSLIIYKSSDSKKENIEIENLLPVLPKGEKWTNYVEEVGGRAISAGNRLNLFSLKLATESSGNRIKLRDKLRSVLYTKCIEVDYSDIYGQKYAKAERTMEFFGRQKKKIKENEKQGKINKTV